MGARGDDGEIVGRNTSRDPNLGRRPGPLQEVAGQEPAAALPSYLVPTTTAATTQGLVPRLTHR